MKITEANLIFERLRNIEVSHCPVCGHNTIQQIISCDDLCIIGNRYCLVCGKNLRKFKAEQVLEVKY